jgi:hypothetical protein
VTSSSPTPMARSISTSPATPGREANWIQTVPNKGWFAIFRLYGPLEPWFDKTWRPGDIEEAR